MSQANLKPVKDIYNIGEIPPAYHVPEKMWAWAIRKERHGRPLTAMQIEQVPTPKCGEDEVLVLVLAAGVNYNGVRAAAPAPAISRRRKRRSSSSSAEPSRVPFTSWRRRSSSARRNPAS